MTLQTLTPTDLPRYGSQVIDVSCLFVGLEFLYSEIFLAKLYLFLFSRYGPKCVFYVYGDLDFDLENFDPKKVFCTSLDIPQFKSTIVFCPRYVSKEEFCDKDLTKTGESIRIRIRIIRIRIIRIRISTITIYLAIL